MRLLPVLIIIYAVFAAGRALSSVSPMEHTRTATDETTRAQAGSGPSNQTQRTVRLRRDGAAQGFFDDDFASDTDWKKFTEKGGAMICGLSGDDEEAGLLMGDKRTPPSAASEWTSDLTHELETWAWSVVNPTTYSCKMNDFWDIPEAMRSLGLNGKPQTEGGDNACYRVEHWNPTAGIPAINQWYKVNGADYQFGINRAGGAIYGYYLDSPVYAASTLWYSGRKPADAAKLPKLRAFSDILWGYWVRNNANVKNIRYFFMLGITNDETNQLIATCLENKRSTLKEWPGTKIDTATDEGHALLGSPNGAAFAYFLMQHKKELGPKTITHVTIFRTETDDDVSFVDPHLVFHVEDVKEGRHKEPDAVEDKAIRAHDFKL